MRKAWLAAFGLVLATASAVGEAQSLADVAKREKERRAKVEAGAKDKEKKTFTNDDLAGSPGASEATPAAAEPAPGESSLASDRAGHPAVGAAGAGSGESYWRGRFAAARRRISDAQAKLTAAQEATAGSMPGPLPPRCPSQTLPPGTKTMLPPPGSTWPGDGGIECARIDQAWKARERAGDPAKAQAELDAARTALADLEEEARRQGALPGWTR